MKQYVNDVMTPEQYKRMKQSHKADITRRKKQRHKRGHRGEQIR